MLSVSHLTGSELGGKPRSVDWEPLFFPTVGRPKLRWEEGAGRASGEIPGALGGGGSWPLPPALSSQKGPFEASLTSSHSSGGSNIS